ncbi:SPFH domain-containing protein [Agrobacterium rubi]|nr:SPFH domain-containing protein [Agrobacterium rubi]NTF23992.1 SPFH domain-containing protein [Agrobacterium rubi]
MSQSVTDRSTVTSSGYAALALSLVLIVAGVYFAGFEIKEGLSAFSQHEISNLHMWGGIAAIFIGIFIWGGVYQLEPNESAVMTFFSSYIGTDKENGLRWANPLNGVTKISRRLQNHNIESIKVNDAAGNPIEIGAAIVWHVNDSAKAKFEVDNYKAYVKIQSETALRKIASQYPYDNWKDDADDADDEQGDKPKDTITSLRDGGEIVAKELEKELAAHLALAGLKVIDARITHLAYSQEIAQAMLKRQQAAAIVAARSTIVKGAVGLVKMAIEGLSQNGLKLDDERKALMATNLMVVMVGDKDATPIINTGTLHG